MVWLHGGAYSGGSSIELPFYDGENLARPGDDVVVSVNHRLNVLGFLDLSAYGEKYAGSANAGIADLIAALQWVNGGIAGFGGDPGNVMIFGQSGGGGKVSTLMAAPSAKGLFQKAAVQSGSLIPYQGTDPQAIAVSKDVPLLVGSVSGRSAGARARPRTGSRDRRWVNPARATRSMRPIVGW